jgi:hypothetical protein
MDTSRAACLLCVLPALHEHPQVDRMPGQPWRTWSNVCGVPPPPPGGESFAFTLTHDPGHRGRLFLTPYPRIVTPHLNCQDTCSRAAVTPTSVQVLTSKEEEAPVSRTEQAKRLLKQYGSAYLITSISFAIVSFAACYAAVSAGVQRGQTPQPGGGGRQWGGRQWVAAVGVRGQRRCTKARCRTPHPGEGGGWQWVEAGRGEGGVDRNMVLCVEHPPLKLASTSICVFECVCWGGG